MPGLAGLFNWRAALFYSLVPAVGGGSELLLGVPLQLFIGLSGLCPLPIFNWNFNRPLSPPFSPLRLPFKTALPPHFIPTGVDFPPLLPPATPLLWGCPSPLPLQSPPPPGEEERVYPLRFYRVGEVILLFPGLSPSPHSTLGKIIEISTIRRRDEVWRGGDFKLYP